MFIETAIGDAYGAGFEFTNTPEVPNDLTKYGRHPKGGLDAGQYTDDTMRSIANARVLLGVDQTDWYRPEAYIREYKAIRKEDRRPGWSTRFEAFLDENEGQSSFLMMKNMQRRATNGCIMGIAPLGYLINPRDVLLAALFQTVSTHAATAVPYAQTIALTSHFLLRGEKSEKAVRLAVERAEWHDLSDAMAFLRLLDDEPPVPAMPVETIVAGALWALLSFETQSEALLWSCSRGGDCDSLAAVTMALMSAASDIKSDIPSNLLRDLEPGAPDKVAELHRLDQEMRENFLS